MINDRITIRLEKELIKSIEKLIRGGEFRSRSELLRVAVTKYINSLSEEGLKEECKVKIKLSKRELKIIKYLVAHGYYGSVEDAIENIVKNYFTSEKLKSLIEEIEFVEKLPETAVYNKKELLNVE